jgi:hypothetical protein
MHRTFPAMLALATAAAFAQTAPSDLMPVTVDTFNRAESDMNFAGMVKGGGFGKFLHRRELVAVDKQLVVRPNRDTLYSLAVFDLAAGPVTISMPEPGARYMSMQVIDEDQYTPAIYYGAGTYTLTREAIATRYVSVTVRTLLDPADPKDVDKAHALQDAIKISQQSQGTFEVPHWDPASQKKVREALVTLAATVPDTKRMFGPREAVDPVRHLIGTAMLWGGTPEKDAVYLNVTPEKNDGTTVYELNFKDVPVDGFWSISVYNARGFLEANELKAYSLNSITAAKSADGSVDVRFGGCNGKAPNCLPIVSGWNYTVRLFRPRAEILNGGWQFPRARPVV